MGNCGVGFAPCRSGDHDLLIGVMEGVEDIPGVVMAEGLTWNWETFPEYLDAVDSRPHDIDVAVYFPHSPLRVYVMGQRGADGEAATPDDLAAMRALAGEAMDAGALGFSTSRQFIHRTRDGAPIPSYDASETELRAIAAGLRDAGRGIIQIVTDAPKIGLAEELRLVERVALDSGRPATFSFGAPNDTSQEWRTFLAQISRANREGASITAQVLPRPIGMVLGFNLSVNPFCHCPTYLTLADLPLAEKVRELRRPEIRERLLAETPGPSASILARVGRTFEYMFPVDDPPDYEPAPERSVAAEARRRGISPESLAYDSLLENNGEAMLFVWLGNYQNGSLDAIYEMLDHDHVVMGLGDGGAHYGMICDATYPTHVLAYGTRDRIRGEPLSIAKAIKALASDPARVVGLLDRGVLAPGYRADLNIIDYDRLQLCAPEVLYDLPAGGRRLSQRAQGFDCTLVAGRIICEKGVPTGELPGRLVRGAQHAPA
jgi:N-acyl-D-aspartate/D-glutamate deacylase